MNKFEAEYKEKRTALVQAYEKAWNDLAKENIFNVLPSDQKEALYKLGEKANPDMVGFVQNQINNAVSGQDANVILFCTMYVSANAATMYESVTKKDFVKLAELAWEVGKERNSAQDD